MLALARLMCLSTTCVLELSRSAEHVWDWVAYRRNTPSGSTPSNTNVMCIKKTGAASRVARGITTLVAAKCKGNKRRTIDGGKAISAPETIGTAERENGRTSLLVTTTTTRGVDSTAVARVGVDTMGKATTTEDLKVPGWGTGIKEMAKVKVDRTTTPGENNPRATVAPGTSAGASRATQS